MKIFSKLFALLLLSSFGLNANASTERVDSQLSRTISLNEKVISYDNLPQEIKDFLSTHFSSYKVIKVEKKLRPSKNGKLYEVDLSKGIDLEFDKKGDWLEIETPRAIGVPVALIPQEITSYVQENFPNEVITSIEKKRYGFEIELGNDLDIKFNKQGGFLSIDN